MRAPWAMEWEGASPETSSGYGLQSYLGRSFSSLSDHRAESFMLLSQWRGLGAREAILSLSR